MQKMKPVSWNKMMMPPTPELNTQRSNRPLFSCSYAAQAKRVMESNSIFLHNSTAISLSFFFFLPFFLSLFYMSAFSLSLSLSVKQFNSHSQQHGNRSPFSLPFFLSLFFMSAFSLCLSLCLCLSLTFLTNFILIVTGSNSKCTTIYHA